MSGGSALSLDLLLFGCQGLRIHDVNVLELVVHVANNILFELKAVHVHWLLCLSESNLGSLGDPSAFHSVQRSNFDVNITRGRRLFVGSLGLKVLHDLLQISFHLLFLVLKQGLRELVQFLLEFLLDTGQLLFNGQFEEAELLGGLQR